MFLPRLSNKKWTLSFAVVGLVAVLLTLTGMKSYQSHQAYILQGASKGSMISLVNEIGGEVVHDFAVIPAISAMLTDDQVSAIKKNNPLIRLFSDAKVKLDGKSDEWHNKKPLRFKAKQSKVVWTAKNKTSEDAELESITINWPAANGALKNLKVNGEKLVKNVDGNSYTHYFDNLVSVQSGSKVKLAMKFDSLSSVSDSDYYIALNLSDGSVVELDSVKQNITRNEQRDTYFPTQVRANELHEMGITGRGVGVAVIDSGLANFEQLEYNSFGEKREIHRLSLVGGKKDKFGHGTHVTSLIANSEVTYTEDGQPTNSFNGIAPDVDLISIKAFDKNGDSTYSDILTAIIYVIENKDRLNIKVLNLSFGSEVQSLYFYDPINVALMAAWDAGITVITSAGNTGPNGMTVGVPGNNPYLITVGATSDNYTPFNFEDDFVASFSSSGPTHAGFIKPELVAPGAHLQGLMSEKSSLFKNYSVYDDNNGYFLLSGTSQATAVTSGIVALMLQDQPNLSPDDVKCRLIDTARMAQTKEGDLGFSIFRQGAGMVDAYEAVMSQASGCANTGMDIKKSLQAEEFYSGPARWNPETEEYYVLENDGFEWDGTAEDALTTQAIIWPPGGSSKDLPHPKKKETTANAIIWPPGGSSKDLKTNAIIWPPGGSSKDLPHPKKKETTANAIIWPPGGSSKDLKTNAIIWPPGGSSKDLKTNAIIWPPGGSSKDLPHKKVTTNWVNQE
ncbi:S8 family peptidase [Psychrosphaera aestuarii]|uniref:S8 family peptidase n=1 Tax=Psychrosphaera aestuarii TaxID=1266052 RepID=UPI001B330C7E|nr:S8 family peptidase [Psychrosphaera aestuarii]